MNLLTLPITTALALAATGPAKLIAAPRTLVAQGNLAYGSGGTTVNAYLQTSIDGGLTWIDIAQWSLTTAASRTVYVLSAETSIVTPYAALDGTLGANTARDGILGSTFRVKYVTTGTYAGGTQFSVDICTDQQA